MAKEKDSYYDASGYVVFTADYHLNRGYCCGYGCRHCPYNFDSVPEPRRSELLTVAVNTKKGKKD